MILAYSRRPVSFCMAASSYKKPVISTLAKSINVIPVYRPEDEKVLGSGRIRFISSKEVEGINTGFIQEIIQFRLGISSIQLENKYSFIVEKVIDDSHLLLRENPEVYDHVKNTEHSYYFIPRMDNTEMYKEAFVRLQNNKCVCIFPEGTSHDRTNFIKLKAGVALMGLGAIAENNTKHLKIIPAGLSYFRREEFRSEVILEFGVPFEVPNEWGELFKTNKKDAIERTLKEIEQRMKAVTLTAPSFKEYSCLLLARSLYVPNNVQLTKEKYSELCKRFSKGYEKLKDGKETKSLKRKLLRYVEELESAGIDDEEVKLIYYSYAWFVRKTILFFFLFHLYLLIALPMIAITAPFLWIIKKRAEKERLNAKEKNPNKIEALDVVSSVKITTFLRYLPLVFVLWLIFCILFVNSYLFNYTKVMVSYSVIIGVATFIFPIYMYVSTLMVDQLFFYMDTMKTRFLLFCYPRNVYKLKDARNKLENEIGEFVNAHIKETDYAKDRILSPNRELKPQSNHKKAKKLEDDLDSFFQKFNLN